MTEQLHFHFSLSCIGKGNGNHSSVLSWRISGTEEPGGLPSMGSQSQTRLKWLSSSSISLYGRTTVCSPVDKRLCCFQFLAIIGKTAVNICGQVLVCILYILSLLLGFLDMRLLDHMASGFFKFRRNYQTFSKEPVPFCILTSSAWEFWLLHIVVSTQNCLFFGLDLLTDVDAHLFFFSDFYWHISPLG